MKATAEQIEEIMSNEDIEVKISGIDNALQGCNILAKYVPNNVIQGAGHDVIWCCGVAEVVNAGITIDDVKKLKELNWMIEDGDYFACFV